MFQGQKRIFCAKRYIIRIQRGLIRTFHEKMYWFVENYKIQKEYCDIRQLSSSRTPRLDRMKFTVQLKRDII